VKLETLRVSRVYPRFESNSLTIEQKPKIQSFRENKFGEMLGAKLFFQVLSLKLGSCHSLTSME